MGQFLRLQEKCSPAYLSIRELISCFMKGPKVFITAQFFQASRNEELILERIIYTLSYLYFLAMEIPTENFLSISFQFFFAY